MSKTTFFTPSSLASPPGDRIKGSSNFQNHNAFSFTKNKYDNTPVLAYPFFIIQKKKPSVLVNIGEKFKYFEVENGYFTSILFSHNF